MKQVFGTFSNPTLVIIFLMVIAAGIAQSQTSSSKSEKVITPNVNLITEGIPPIPASLAKAVDRYSSAYGLPLAGWHPERRELWLKGLSGTVTWLSRVEAPGSAPQTFVYIPAGLAYDVYIQTQAKYLLYNVDTAGDERFQFYLYDVANRTSTLLTDGKSRNTEPVWSRAGDKFIYSSAPPNAEGVSLYVMNPLDPKSNRLVVQSAGSYLKAYDWSPDDRQVIYADFTSNTNSSLWLLDVSSGKKTNITQQRSGGGVYYNAPRFSADGKGIYVITDRDSDVRRLAYSDLATGEFRYLTNGKWDVESFRLSPNGQIIEVDSF